MPPDSPADRTRLRLLTAASAEMIERGYSAASMSHIAARLGLTKGALAHHFPMKRDIAAAVFDRANALADEAASTAREHFPDHAMRACIAYFAGLARAGWSDPIAAASLALFQDRAVPVDIAMRSFARSQELIGGFLDDYVAKQGGVLRMSAVQSALFLQLLVSGELTVSRFLPDYSPQNAVDSFAAALAGLGIPDPEGVVADGIRAVWTS